MLSICSNQHIHTLYTVSPLRNSRINKPNLYIRKLIFHFFLSFPGKTRTKDKYRVVYSDHQRLELEKEFHYSRYITIRRKAELAANLGLSERQVMMISRTNWFNVKGFVAGENQRWRKKKNAGLLC